MHFFIPVKMFVFRVPEASGPDAELVLLSTALFTSVLIN